MQLAATHLASTVVLFIWAAFFISFFYFSSVSSCFLNSNPASCLHHKHCLSDFIFFLRWYKLEICITKGASNFQLTSFALMKYIKHKGPTIWLLRGVWVISEKKILRTDFEGWNYCKEITGKKIPTLKKIYFTAYNAGEKILHRCMSRKNSITRGLRKKLLHKQNHKYPLSKVK